MSIESLTIERRPSPDATFLLDTVNGLQRGLDRDGYLSLHNVTTERDIDTILHHVEKRLAQPSTINTEWMRDLGDDRRVTTNTGALEVINFTHIEPSLKQTLTFRNALNLSRLLLGPNTIFLFDHCIVKPAGSQTTTAWHQDNAYAGRFTWVGDRLHWWIPLQAVDLSNSCMQFIPGSHNGPLLPHRQRSSTAHAKQVDSRDIGRAVACPLPLGGATIHTGKTLHFTGANDTNRPRYAWIVQFGVKRRFPSIVR